MGHTDGTMLARVYPHLGKHEEHLRKAQPFPSKVLERAPWLRFWRGRRAAGRRPPCFSDSRNAARSASSTRMAPRLPVRAQANAGQPPGIHPAVDDAGRDCASCSAMLLTVSTPHLPLHCPCRGLWG